MYIYTYIYIYIYIYMMGRREGASGGGGAPYGGGAQPLFRKLTFFGGGGGEWRTVWRGGDVVCLAWRRARRRAGRHAFRRQAWRRAWRQYRAFSCRVERLLKEVRTEAKVRRVWMGRGGGGVYVALPCYPPTATRFPAARRHSAEKEFENSAVRRRGAC